MIEQAKFPYTPLRRALKSKEKTIEDVAKKQRETIEDAAGKQTKRFENVR